MTKYPFSKEDIPFEVAKRAHAGTSFSPEKRAKSHQNEYYDFLESVYDKHYHMAERLDSVDKFEEAFEYYQKRYLKKYLAYLRSMHGFMSTMITGPANFPVRRMEKKSETINKRLNELVDYGRYMEVQMVKKYDSDYKDRSSGIRSGSSGALDKLKAKLIAEEKVHATNLAVNKLFRKAKKKTSDPDENYKYFSQELEKLDLSNKGREEYKRLYLRAQNWDGATGLAFTGNSAARLRALKKRIKVEERLAEKKQEGNKRLDFNDGYILANYDVNRVQIFFNDIPDAELRKKLKGAGQAFKWSPKNKAWQRQLNTYNWSYLSSLFPEVAGKKLEPVKNDEPIEDDTVKMDLPKDEETKESKYDKRRKKLEVDLTDEELQYIEDHPMIIHYPGVRPEDKKLKGNSEYIRGLIKEHKQKSSKKSQDQVSVKDDIFKTHPIVLEWTEGSSDEWKGFKDIESLAAALKKYGFTESPDKTYIKNKVHFKGYPSYIRIDSSKISHDYDHSKEKPGRADLLMTYLEERAGDYEFYKLLRNPSPKEVNKPENTITNYDDLPKDVQEALNNGFDQDGDPYKEAEAARRRLSAIGWEMDYDLSGTPSEFWPVDQSKSKKEPDQDQKPSNDDHTGEHLYYLEYEIGALEIQIEQLEMMSKSTSDNPLINLVNAIPKITPESAQKETGAKTGSKKDIATFWLSKTGVSVAKASEKVFESLPKHFQDHFKSDSYIRDIIIEVIQYPSKKAYIDELTGASELPGLRKKLKDLQSKYDQFLSSFQSGNEDPQEYKAKTKGKPGSNKARQIAKQKAKEKAEEIPAKGSMSVLQVVKLGRQIQALRGYYGDVDLKTDNKKRLAPTRENLIKWAQAPGKFDLIGVDNFSAVTVTVAKKKAPKLFYVGLTGFLEISNVE